jgi:ubiquinone/menaquinone biosynthesis C-methylase UbiE
VPKPTWVIDEAAHAGEHHLLPSFVGGYDHKAQFDPTADLAYLVEHGLEAGGCLVDLGGGTGELALAAARVCRRVVLVDVSRPMLDAARTKADDQGLTNLEFVEAGFLGYRHEGPPADIVFSKNALHHLPDFWKVLALRRVASVLKPGGLLRLHDLAYHCEPDEVHGVIEAWLDAAPETGDVGWSRAELINDVRDEHITFSWLLEEMLRRTGFEILEAHHRDPRPFAAYLCRRGADSPA